MRSLEPYLASKNGPELSARFTAAWPGSRLAMRRAAVKAVLLDQRVVAGLGNIYADEALWRARVSPLLPAQDLGADEIRDCSARSERRFGRGSSARDRRCPSIERRTAHAARCRRSSACTAATACRVVVAVRRSRRPESAAGARGTALAASRRVSRSASHSAGLRRSNSPCPT